MSFKDKNNTQKLPKLPQNKFEKDHQTTFLTTKSVKNDP